MIRKSSISIWIMIFLSLWFIQSGCSSSEDASEFVKCKMCGMNAAISQGKFSLFYADGEIYHTCSGHCAALIAAHKETELKKAEAYAFDLNKMVNVKEAFFVVDADIIPENSMYPSVFSFAEEEKAHDFQKIHGGKLTDFNGVLDMGKKKP